MLGESLKNKIIIVTGGNGLIGSNIVDFLRNCGSEVINADISNTDDMDSANLKVDITDEDEVNFMLRSVMEKYGRLDGLVNNAYPRTEDWGVSFEDVSLSSWRKNIDMQLNSVFMLCQKVLGIMHSQKSGSVVNIASIYGVVGNDFTLYQEFGGTSPAAYFAIKGGLINFTRYLASYYGSAGIRVNSVSPGGILDEELQHPSFIKRYSEKSPLKRLGNADEIAGPVAFLLSDDASYITGHNLMVDGGWTII